MEEEGGLLGAAMNCIPLESLVALHPSSSLRKTSRAAGEGGRRGDPRGRESGEQIGTPDSWMPGMAAAPSPSATPMSDGADSGIGGDVRGGARRSGGGRLRGALAAVLSSIRSALTPSVLIRGADKARGAAGNGGGPPAAAAGVTASRGITHSQSGDFISPFLCPTLSEGTSELSAEFKQAFPLPFFYPTPH